jgi:pentatricopeptide repeat protein
VCKSVGDADKAYNVYLDLKRQALPLDAHVFAAVISAFAEGMRRELEATRERKEQYVLLERAMLLLKEAEDSGIRLSKPPWNALLVCAGRCGQLERAFSILDSMQQHGLVPDAVTYGALAEACIQSGQPQAAMRVYDRALREVSLHGLHQEQWCF